MSTIVFDVDGVLAYFIGPAVEKGYELTGRLGPGPGLWVQRCWDDYGGLTSDEVQVLWKWIKENPTFWFDLPPLISVEEANGIVALENAGHRVYFATNRRLPGALDQTRLWLQTHIGIGCPSVVLTKRKGEFCRCVDADYYIDDKSENVDCAIWMTDGKTKAFVMHNTTNVGQYAPHSSKARRVYSVTEFLTEVNT
jgi:hypothetical protein